GNGTLAARAMAEGRGLMARIDGRLHQPCHPAVSRQPLAIYFFSCSMTVFACAASCDVGSALMTFSSILMVASLSPLLSWTRASLKIGLPQDGSRSTAF